VLNAQGRSWLTAVGRLLDIFASLGIVVATGLIAWHMLGSSAAVSRALPIPSEPVSLDQAERLGRSEAKVVLIVFSDFSVSVLLGVLQFGTSQPASGLRRNRTCSSGFSTHALGKHSFPCVPCRYRC
jgi:hypothetical protein